MRQRQKTQEHLVAEPEHFEQAIGAAAIGEDVAVAGHHPLGQRRRCRRCRSGRRCRRAPARRCAGAMSSGRAAPRARTSSHDRTSTALAWPAAGSIAITVCTVSTWLAAASTRADKAGLETITARSAAVGEDVAMVLDGVGRVGRHRDRPGAHDRQIGDDPFRPVLGHQADPLAGPMPSARSPLRQPPDVARRRRPVDRPIAPVALDPQRTACRRAGPPVRRTSPAGWRQLS